MGLGEFLPSNAFMDWFAGFFCDEGGIQGICTNIIFVLCGFDEAQVNRTLLETIMHHTPAGSSTNSFVHFAQEINSKKFSAFDYGNENSDIYGQDTPPEYDLTQVNVPIGLYWGENDWLAHPSVSFIKKSFLILKFTFDCKIGISGYFETFDQTPQRCAQLRSSL